MENQTNTDKAKDEIWEIFTSLKLQKDDEGRPEWCDENNLWVFCLDAKSGNFMYSNSRIWLRFYEKYKFSYAEVDELVKSEILEVLNFKYLKPHIYPF